MGASVLVLVESDPVGVVADGVSDVVKELNGDVPLAHRVVDEFIDRFGDDFAFNIDESGGSKSSIVRWVLRIPSVAFGHGFQGIGGREPSG